MRYETRFLTDNDCFRYGGILQPQGILLHSTGVDQRRISAYTVQWNRPGVEVCVHGMLGLDDAGALCYTQILPYSTACWGCGAGKYGSYNRSHIQFEICEDQQDPDWCRLTYVAALEVCEGLCRRYGLRPDSVVCHSEAHARGYASNHGDVMHWWPKHGLSMDGFRRELRERLEEKQAMKRYQTLAEVPEALRQETAELMDAGALRGTGGAAGLDVTEDMLRTMIVCKRYAELLGKGEANAE